MPKVRIPSVEDLLHQPLGEVERQLIRSARRMTARDRMGLQFHVEKAFCRSCFEGDLERVSYFVEGLPPALAGISDQILQKGFGLAWAAYGDQHHIIEYICQRLDDEILFGNDYRHALDAVTPVGELTVGQDQWQPDCALVTVCKVASERNSPALINILEPFVDRALDRHICYQIQQ